MSYLHLALGSKHMPFQALVKGQGEQKRARKFF